MQDTVVWRTEIANVMSAVVALASASGHYTDEARSCVEACALALGVELASPSEWHVWMPGDDVDVQRLHSPRGSENRLLAK